MDEKNVKRNQTANDVLAGENNSSKEENGEKKLSWKYDASLNLEDDNMAKDSKTGRDKETDCLAAYDWDGYLFNGLLENHCIAKAKRIPEIQDDLRNEINWIFSDNTINLWRMEGNMGPRIKSDVQNIDKTYSNIRFLTHPCEVKRKEALFDLYTNLWELHYQYPLAVGTEKWLENEIENIREISVERKTPVGKQRLETDILNEEDRRGYIHGLLHTFLDKYIQIIQPDGEVTYHVLEDDQQRIYAKKVNGTYVIVNKSMEDENYFKRLKEMQEHLQWFGDNLRDLFLGEDL